MKTDEEEDRTGHHDRSRQLVSAFTLPLRFHTPRGKLSLSINLNHSNASFFLSTSV